MAEYALIQDNQVVELHDLLPMSWKNISGLRLSANDIPFLNSLGWYQVTKQIVDYDTTAQKVTGYTYTFVDNIVTETPVIENKEIQYQTSFDQLKIQFMEELREKRNKLLAESDFSQLIDVQNILSDDEKISWTHYRQTLRDLPETYSNNDELNVNLVVFPTKPSDVV